MGRLGGIKMRVTVSWRRYLTAGLMVAVLIAVLALPASAGGFARGIVIPVDGDLYYMEGAPDAPGGAFDIPGHAWVLAGKNQVVGKHYNTGPFGAPQWWSSDAPDGELLYIVHGIIDTWSVDKAQRYAQRGYTHYHELRNVVGGAHHPTKVVWLRHIARTSFTFDGGPHPELGSHAVTPGIDREFLPNGGTPYSP
jgi:selenium-binding protein 1